MSSLNKHNIQKERTSQIEIGRIGRRTELQTGEKDCRPIIDEGSEARKGVDEGSRLILSLVILEDVFTFNR